MKKHPLVFFGGCIAVYIWVGFRAGFAVSDPTNRLRILLINFVEIVARLAFLVTGLRYVLRQAESANLALREIRWPRFLGLLLWLIFPIVIGTILAAAILAALQTWEVPEPAQGELFRSAMVLALCGALFLEVRFILVIPHVAIGGRFEWRKSWLDTRSHFWTIVGGGVFTVFPLTVVSLLAFWIGAFLYKTDPVKVGAFYVRPVFSLLTVISVIVLSAYLAGLYRRLGERLINPTDY